jgi:aminobenzoyl-glutamate utilization protein A
LEALLKDNPGLINAKDDERGGTPLHFAASAGKVRAVDMLLEKGADVNTPDKDGFSPVVWAVRSGKVDVVNKLTDSGASLDFSDSDMGTLMHFAAADAGPEMLRCLAGKGLDIHPLVRDLYTPLFVAVFMEKAENIGTLIRLGADPLRENREGMSPFFAAVNMKNADLMESFLRNGVDNNCKSTIGYAPLHAAVYSGDTERTEMLLADGAAVNITDGEGNTALDIARSRGFENLSELLVQNRGKSGSADIQDLRDLPKAGKAGPGLKAPVTVTVIYDNYVHKEGLEADWGFSVLIQGTDKTVLFDTGTRPELFLRNFDALDLQESECPSHRPAAEGFASVNEGVSHACGHDGHAAIGLAVAHVLTQFPDAMGGTVRLIFQPAEEGVRGAAAMVSAGVLDDVDFLVGLHLYSGWPTGQLTPGQSGFLATRKFDAWFEGQAAHAGGGPHRGKNAMLAAATAVLNLHALPRHREGASRVNVGRLTAGMGRNVICPNAHLVIETRGQTTAIDAMMYERAIRILEGAAAMHDCGLTVREMGRAESATSDPKLADRVAEIATHLDGYTTRAPEMSGGSEDFTVMMRKVQGNGGLATNIGFGADLGGFGHHTPIFDFDEGALRMATALLSHVTLALLRNPIALGS